MPLIRWTFDLSSPSRIVRPPDPAVLLGLLTAYVLRVGLIGLTIAALIRAFVRHVIRAERPGPIWKRLALLGLTFLLLFLVAEALFTFYPQSHGAGPRSLSEANWFAYFWRPVNSLGFRDIEPDPDLPQSTRTVLVVGDSYTAGHGIVNASDRYSDVLQEMLGDGYAVFNLGRNGAATRAEFDLLSDYPIRPDLIVLQYCKNDINRIAASHGLVSPGKQHIARRYNELNSVVRALFHSSYLVDLLFWRTFQQTSFGPGEEANERSHLARVYGDEAVLNEHLLDLDLFVAFAEDLEAPLIVIVMPILTDEDLESSRVFIDPISRHLDRRGVATVDPSATIRSIVLSERVINELDSHASVKVHREIARLTCHRIDSLRADDWRCQSVDE